MMRFMPYGTYTVEVKNSHRDMQRRGNWLHYHDYIIMLHPKVSYHNI